MFDIKQYIRDRNYSDRQFVDGTVYRVIYALLEKEYPTHALVKKETTKILQELYNERMVDK